MPWNSLRSWLARPACTSLARQPRRFNLEMLETRLTPSFTVGPNINITQSAAGDAETAIVVNPTNPQNLFATSTGDTAHKFSTDGGTTWQDSDLSAVDGGASAGDEQMA